MKCFVALLMCGVILPGSLANHIFDFLELPKHDGVQRVYQISTELELTTMIKQNPVLVVLITQNAAAEFPGNFAEELAQILARRGVSVVLTPQQTVKDSAPGSIYLYRDAKKFTYFGRKCAQSFLRYLQKMSHSRTTIIAGKLDKAAFDQARQTKIVGYFVNGSPEHQVFEEAAALFSPMVSFYVILDAAVAKHMKFNATGQIGVFREFDKLPVVCQTNPAALSDIQQLIVLNRDSSMVKVTEHNMNDPSLMDASKPSVLFITDVSPLSLYMRKLVTRVIRNATISSKILWIDAADFPMLSELGPEQAVLGLSTLPALGVVDAASNAAVWFDTTSINATVADRISEEQNFITIKTWLSSQGIVLKNAQMFSMPPQDIEIAEGAEATMTCVVANKVGDCLWLKDSKSIGYTLSQYPHIKWRDATQSGGDCSIIINPVQSMDEGTWSCQVTGDAIQQTITSTHAKLIVVPAPKAEL